jgi:hypothetical protein
MVSGEFYNSSDSKKVQKDGRTDGTTQTLGTKWLEAGNMCLR